LFPHRPMNPTRTADPSKHASRAFGEYLTKFGLTDPLHVFHSFRHTVISRMHVCAVPVGDAELIVGHAAQDASIRAHVARSHASRSGVHLGTYCHPSVYTVDTEPVLARLKRRLDSSLTFQLDVYALRKAAAIVLDNTQWVEPRSNFSLVSHWISGWHTNARARADREVSRLAEAWEPPRRWTPPSTLKAMSTQWSAWAPNLGRRSIDSRGADRLLHKTRQGVCCMFLQYFHNGRPYPSI